METVEKRVTENAVISLNGYQIKYSLLHSENGLYGIACSCKKGGHVLSDYVNTNLFSIQSLAEQTFRILVDNAVFPVHIPDILLDLAAESDFKVPVAIA